MNYPTQHSSHRKRVKEVQDSLKISMEECHYYLVLRILSLGRKMFDYGHTNLYVWIGIIEKMIAKLYERCWTVFLFPRQKERECCPECSARLYIVSLEAASECPECGRLYFQNESRCFYCWSFGRPLRPVEEPYSYEEIEATSLYRFVVETFKPMVEEV